MFFTIRLTFRFLAIIIINPPQLFHDMHVVTIDPGHGVNCNTWKNKGIVHTLRSPHHQNHNFGKCSLGHLLCTHYEPTCGTLCT
jgi:hypothetical protein